MILQIVTGFFNLFVHLCFLNLLFIWIVADITFKWVFYFAHKIIVLYSTYLFYFLINLKIPWKLYRYHHVAFYFFIFNVYYLLLNFSLVTWLLSFLVLNNKKFYTTKLLITYVLKCFDLTIMKKIIIERNHYYMVFYCWFPYFT